MTTAGRHVEARGAAEAPEVESEGCCCCRVACTCACCGYAKDGPDVCSFSCCSYPNGVLAIVIAQFLLSCAVLFSAASMADCKFVKADLSLHNNATSSFPTPPEYLPQEGPTFYGFYFYLGDDGGCYWDPDYTASMLEGLFDYTGHDWLAPRALGSLAAMIGFVIWLWALLFSCSAHPKAIRLLLAGVLILVVTPFQCSTLIVLGSDFCDEFNCKFGRSAGFSVAAMFGFLSSGCCFLLMKNFPGKSGTMSIEADSENDGLEMMAARQGWTTQETESHHHNEDGPSSFADGIGAAQEVPHVDLSLLGAGDGCGNTQSTIHGTKEVD